MRRNRFQGCGDLVWTNPRLPRKTGGHLGLKGTIPLGLAKETRVLEINVGLHVDIIGVAGAEGRGGESLVDRLAGEEVAIAGFELGETSDGVTSDGVELGAEEGAVIGIDAVAGAGRGGDAATRDAADCIEVVVGIGEPEA